MINILSYTILLSWQLLYINKKYIISRAQPIANLYNNNNIKIKIRLIQNIK